MKYRCLCVIALILILPGCTQAQSLENDLRLTSRFELIEKWVETQMDYEEIPGMSMGLVLDQDLIWSRGFGFAHLEEKAEATPKTIYSICSISKLFTSIAVMQLWEQKMINLDTPISEYLSWFNIQDTYPDAPEVTLRAILTHSAGLPREADFPYWTGPEYDFPKREEIIDRLSCQEELYPADTYYQYSNLGLTLAGEVVAAVSAMPYDVYVRQNILDPLGLNDTSPEIPEDQKGGRLATGYTSRLRDGSRKPIPFYFVNGIAPAAGYASTVEDLAKFASWQFRLLQNGGKEVLAVNTLKSMQRVHWLDQDWVTTRGLGFSVSKRNGKIFVGHGGSCPGYRTQLYMCPKDKIAVIVMTNAQGVSPSAYAREIFDILAPQIEETQKSPGKAKKIDPALRKFIGRYDRPWGGETHVMALDGELVTVSFPTDNPSRSITKLKHIKDNVFKRVRRDGVLAEKVIFEIGPDGQVTRMVRNSNYSIRVN